MKDLIKKNTILYKILTFPRSLYVDIVIGKIFAFVVSFLPIKKYKIVADNFNGHGFGDSPGAIVEELMKRPEGKKFDFVWVLNKDYYDCKLPKGVRKVKYKSARFYYELATAKVWIDNVRKLACPRKKKKQFYVQTWHSAAGAKKVEGDAILPHGYVRAAKKDSRYANLFLSGSNHMSRLYKTAFWYSGEISEYGTPKLDKMVRENDNRAFIDSLRKKIFSQFEIKDGTGIVLYAPTFRDQSDYSYDLDYKRIVACLKKKYKKDWVIFLRFHPNVLNDICKKNTDSHSVVDVTRYADLYELIQISDVIISDYSSIEFEAAIISKPVFVYAPDYETYTKKERGLYFDLKALPFPFAKTNDALIENLEENDLDLIGKKMNEIKQMIGLNETGKSAEVAAAKIIETIG